MLKCPQAVNRKGYDIVSIKRKNADDTTVLMNQVDHHWA
jgi:hypothetical protein